MSTWERGHYEIDMGTGDLVWVAAGVRAIANDVTRKVTPAVNDVVEDLILPRLPDKPKP